MNEPGLYLKCSNDCSFLGWTPCKLYPVTLSGNAWNDEGGLYRTSILADQIPGSFKLIWLLPDGTELEALE